MLLYEGLKDAVYALAFSPDGATVIGGARDGVVMQWEASGPAEPLIEPGPKASAIHALAYLPDGALAIGHEGGWNLYRRNETGWCVAVPSSPTPTTALAAVGANLLAVGTGERGQTTAGTFELWDVKARRRIDPFFREAHGVRAVAACPAKELVAWANGSRLAFVWDIRRQTPVRFTLTRNSPALALAPDGSTLAAATDYTVRLFHLGLRQERAVLKGHKGIVSTVAFSPDGSTVASGSWDQTVRLWDAASGRERAVFTWGIGRICSLAYAPDGLRLAAGGDRGAVMVWDLD